MISFLGPQKHIMESPFLRSWDFTVLLAAVSRAGQTRMFSRFCVFAHPTRRHFADAMGEDQTLMKDATCHGREISRILKCKYSAKKKKLTLRTKFLTLISLTSRLGGHATFFKLTVNYLSVGGKSVVPHNSQPPPPPTTTTHITPHPISLTSELGARNIRHSLTR